MEGQDRLKKDFKVTSMVSMAMIASLLIYPAIVEVIKYQNAPFEGFGTQSLSQLKDMFLIVPVFMFLMVRLVRNSILKKSRSDDLNALLNKLKISTILTLALCEISAIVGLVLFLTGGLYKEFYVLLLCSMAAMVIYFPRLDHWAVWIRSTPR
jgi:hypothetical protein